jgi:hypothetical protein
MTKPLYLLFMLNKQVDRWAFLVTTSQSKVLSVKTYLFGPVSSDLL